METIKSESLSLCLKLIELKQKFYASTFGKLIVESKKSNINVFEKGYCAYNAKEISEIVNACVNLFFYVEYDPDKCEYKYHIF